MKLSLYGLLLPVVFVVSCFAQDKPKPAPDVLVFNNGDQLTGKFERAVGESVLFKSDMAGELTIGFDKIKQLKTTADVVALKKSAPQKLVIVAKGNVAVEAGNVVVTPQEDGKSAMTFAPKDLAFLIDEPTYDHEVAHQPGFLHGWNGTVTGGATLVRSTTTGTTLTAGLSLVRAIPTVPYLPARNRTVLNVVENYGKQTSPGAIPQTVPATPDVVTKTSIFHADAERDEYFRPTLYVLVDTSQDHNYSQGMALQQVYGGGVGWTPIKSGKQELDVKADVHFEKQHYFSPQLTPGVSPSAPPPDVNLFGSTIGESYMRNLPRKIVFTEVGTYLPGWTDSRAYSANVTGTLAMPVFKRLSVMVSTTDNFLNDPNPGYKKNSYQFVTGVTYSLK